MKPVDEKISFHNDLNRIRNTIRKSVNENLYYAVRDYMTLEGLDIGAMFHRIDYSIRNEISTI